MKLKNTVYIIIGSGGKKNKKKVNGSDGIRTHAHVSELRPERSAVDHLATLPFRKMWQMYILSQRAKPLVNSNTSISNPFHN